jgi:hypothetical protein
MAELDITDPNPLKQRLEDYEDESLLDHAHPNSLTFDDTGRLYVADSKGIINVWDLQVLIIVFSIFILLLKNILLN